MATLITQKQLQEGLQTGLDTVIGFNSPSTIQGDTILDEAIANLPFAMILTARNYELIPAPGRMIGTYTIPVTIFVEFVDWEESGKAVRDIEQGVHDKFFTDGSMWSAGGLSGVSLIGITASDIGEVYPENDGGGQVLPVFLTRTMDFEIELF